MDATLPDIGQSQIRINRVGAARAACPEFDAYLKQLALCAEQSHRVNLLQGKLSAAQEVERKHREKLRSMATQVPKELMELL